MISSLIAAARFDYAELRPQSARRGTPRRVLVLTCGDNPTFNYYIKPRIAGCTHLVIDIERESPRDFHLAESDYVLICRYLSSGWAAKLHRSAPLAGVGMLIDDDYRAFVRDRQIPLLYRLHVARYGLGGICAAASLLTDMFVSTEYLRACFHASDARVIGPLPSREDLAAAPARGERPRIAFHAKGSHHRDHAFCAEVLRRVAAAAPSVEIDVVGPHGARRLWRDVPGARFRFETDWNAYRNRAAAEGADILLSPLVATPVNRGRAPTKVIDAVRLGAAGVFSDLEPYDQVHDDAPRLGEDVDAWVRTTLDLVRSPGRRADLADRLRRQVESWRPAPVPPWLL